MNEQSDNEFVVDKIDSFMKESDSNPRQCEQKSKIPFFYGKTLLCCRLQFCAAPFACTARSL